MGRTYIYQKQNNALNMLAMIGGRSTAIYSTTEQVAGEWINGKPMYRTVFPLGTITDATATLGTTDSVYATTNQLTNVETVIRGMLIGVMDDIDAPYASPIHVFVKDDYVHFSSFMTLSTTQGTNYIVVEYTKTTDTADINISGESESSNP